MPRRSFQLVWNTHQQERASAPSGRLSHCRTREVKEHASPMAEEKWSVAHGQELNQREHGNAASLKSHNDHSRALRVVAAYRVNP